MSRHRKWPQGRIAPDDDGELVIAVETDPARKVLKIHFGKPVRWIGLGKAEVNGLIELLQKRVREIE